MSKPGGKAAMSETADQTWQALTRHHGEWSERRLSDLFDHDQTRFDTLSHRCGGLLVDFSKNLITGETLSLLSELARARGVEAQRDAMYSGAHVNATEGRPALHTALRNTAATPVLVDGINVMPQIIAVLRRMHHFAQSIRDASLRSYTDARFTDVINIGIGGSDLGPAMATAALAPFHDGPRLHFISNVDGAHFTDTVRDLDPRTTLFIIASKTFTTAETMLNAATARRWIVEALGEPAVAKHFAALSTALDKVDDFGIHPDHVFGFWDWIGGRYSLWSAIGLPIMIAIGPERFEQMLSGAHAMDIHFRKQPIERNIPMLMGLVGVWYRNLWKFGSRAVVPYDQRLARLPAYLQQLDLESNGKRVKADGSPLSCDSAPIVWGQPGTNGQHAFFQALHQGTQVVPCEFLIAAQGHEPQLTEHHSMLVANCLAQSEALMRGRTQDEAHAQLLADGHDATDAARLAPHKTFPGNRPSTTLIYPRLTPDMLGRLIALYEHRTFVEGAIWGINSFDQWGVELGKELATSLLPAVTGESPDLATNGSTSGLLAYLHNHENT